MQSLSRTECPSLLKTFQLQAIKKKLLQQTNILSLLIRHPEFIVALRARIITIISGSLDSETLRLRSGRASSE
jgi:hypothetical protein